LAQVLRKLETKTKHRKVVSQWYRLVVGWLYQGTKCLHRKSLLFIYDQCMLDWYCFNIIIITEQCGKKKKIRNSREELLIKSQYTCNNINCKCWIYTETHRIRKNGPQKNRGTWDLHKNTMCQGQASIKHDCSLGSQLYKDSQPVPPLML
jgi:hypothetical protein